MESMGVVATVYTIQETPLNDCPCNNCGSITKEYGNIRILQYFKLCIYTNNKTQHYRAPTDTWTNVTSMIIIMGTMS